jgi:zinc transporter, ZIP family
MPMWLQAGLWGLLAGAALLIGALFGWFSNVSRRWVASIMAFGSGVLISALAFDLMDEAAERGGLGPTLLGFGAGAGVYTLGNLVLSRYGAKHRKRSGEHQPSEEESSGSGLAIALGALLDGIPESMVIGVSLLDGGKVSLVAVAAVFLSNVPEGLSSSAGMKHAGRSPAYVFGIWSTIAVLSGVSALVGFALFRGVGPGAVSATMGVAAGAILVMIIDTMAPESFEGTHDMAGLITVGGFAVAFALSRWAE